MRLARLILQWGSAGRSRKILRFGILWLQIYRKQVNPIIAKGGTTAQPRKGGTTKKTSKSWTVQQNLKVCKGERREEREKRGERTWPCFYNNQQLPLSNYALFCEMKLDPLVYWTWWLALPWYIQRDDWLFNSQVYVPDQTNGALLNQEQSSPAGSLQGRRKDSSG